MDLYFKFKLLGEIIGWTFIGLFVLFWIVVLIIVNRK